MLFGPEDQTEVKQIAKQVQRDYIKRITTEFEPVISVSHKLLYLLATSDECGYKNVTLEKIVAGRLRFDLYI